ncbi:MAG TPA: SMI1/KNR4 family protein [Candidatus Sulfotelmatobacter sp.]|nr:SMI1/KNR4 family protein [Candidatus Sulfotelmatobacter sp.]
MKIKLKGGKSAPQKALQELETALGCRISISFRRFVSKNDGAEPEPNIFNIGKDNNAGVNQFIPISEIWEERQDIDNIPRQAYPIARASCGNYVLLDESKGGQVYFWDHELPVDNIIKLANNFDEFLSMLEPLDINSIKLKPGQVKKVWFAPDFLKRIKE